MKPSTHIIIKLPVWRIRRLDQNPRDLPPMTMIRNNRLMRTIATHQATNNVSAYKRHTCRYRLFSNHCRPLQISTSPQFWAYPAVSCSRHRQRTKSSSSLSYCNPQYSMLLEEEGRRYRPRMNSQNWVCGSRYLLCLEMKNHRSHGILVLMT
jgi:hypothetical protein